MKKDQAVRGFLSSLIPHPSSFLNPSSLPKRAATVQPTDKSEPSSYYDDVVRRR
jgi:hypothetical protein